MAKGVTIRRAVPRDAEGLYALNMALIEDGRGMVLSRQDIKPDEDRKAKLTTSLAREFDGRMGLYLVAERAGQIVGSGELQRIRLVRLMHNVRLSLGVHPDVQGQGVGRQLMDQLLDWARTVKPRIRRVSLGVLADNDRAIALYASLGFVQEGRQRGFLWRDGAFIDNLQMALTVNT